MEDDNIMVDSKNDDDSENFTCDDDDDHDIVMTMIVQVMKWKMITS